VTSQPEAEEKRSLKSKIDQDIKEALKARNNLKLGVLRMLKSEIKYKEIDKGSELSDDEVISVLSSSVKKRKDSIEQFEKGGREDLVSQEKAELEVVMGYMPEQLGEDELIRIIQQAIQETNAGGPADLGKVMKSIIPQVKGRADGKLINRLVAFQLQSFSDSSGKT
jgi:uncharacterized protein YqeY